MLTRWDPFREMMSMRHAMDRLIENTMGEDWEHSSEWSLALDLVENDNEYLVKASLPGVKPDDIDITYDKGVLTIKGEVKQESETNEGQYHLRERRYGAFSRSVALPTSVRAEKIDAQYQDGVLTLKLPKADEVKPKRIPIQSGAAHKVLQGKN